MHLTDFTDTKFGIKNVENVKMLEKHSLLPLPKNVPVLCSAYMYMSNA